MELEDLSKKFEIETENLLNNILKILNCIQISKTPEDAVENYKVFCHTLKKLAQKVEVCLKGLFTRKQRNRSRLCISQICKCLPILGLVLQDHEEYNPVESKHYILKRLEICFLELKNLLVNKTDLIENAEGEGSRFVHTMNAALQVISCIESHVHTESFDTSIRCVKMAVEDLLSRAMYIFQVSCHAKKDDFQAACTEVSRRLQALSNECLSERRNGTAIRISGKALRAALEDLEHLVNKILLHLYLEVFSDPFDILLKILQACGSSPLPVNYRKSTDLPVEAFDRHMERMLILGQFAIASSENAKRVLAMSSCVASLESLDTEMVAAMTTMYLQPKNVRHKHYLDQLMRHYKDEVVNLRILMDTVVDPATFCSVAELEIRRMVKVFKKTSAEPIAILKGIAKEIVKKTEMLLHLVNVVMELEEMQPVPSKINSSLTSLLKLASKACRMCSVAVHKLCDGSLDSDKEKILKRLKLILTYVSRMSPFLEELMNEYHFSAVKELEKYGTSNEGESSSVAESSIQKSCHSSGIDFPNSISKLPVDMDTFNFSSKSDPGCSASPDKTMRESILYMRKFSAITEKKSLSMLAVEDTVMIKPQMLFNRRRYHSSCSVYAPSDEEEINETLTFDFTEILEKLSPVPDTLTSNIDQASHSSAEVHCSEGEFENVEMELSSEEQKDKPDNLFSVKQESIKNIRTFHSANQSSKILKFIRKKYCRFRKMYRSKNSLSKICHKSGKLGFAKQSYKQLRVGKVAPMEHGQVNGHLCSPSSPLSSDRCSATFWESREAHLNGVPFCESVMNCSIQEVNSSQTFKDLCCVSNICSLESNRTHSNHAVNKQSSDSYK